MTRAFFGGCAALVGASLLANSGRAQGINAKDIVPRGGVARGVALLVGEAGGQAIDLARQSELLIGVQTGTEADAIKIQDAASRAGLLGQRIFVMHGPLARLHFADNMADVVVAGPDVPKAELLRVLRPGAKALTGKEEVTKPAPERIDDWTHPYHGPDNNPQSRDQIARAPYLTHFLAEPWYSPMPLVTVAAGGRLFKAFGHVAIKEREWPLLNTLVCQNAFNGTILWQRPLSTNFMIHRSTMIATPDTLYLADDQSCKLLDAATGAVRDEVKSTEADGRVWKWMALVDGTLYALVGPDEAPDPTVRGERRARGWPWGLPLGRGYNSKDYPWGFGRTVLALDPRTKQVLWRHRETELLDTRAMCLAAGRIIIYSHGKFLAALDAKTGRELWRTSDAETLAAVGEHKFAQNPTEGFSTSSFVKANAQAIYFAGPTRADLAAVSAENGKLLWRKEKGGNSQLVLRDDGLYAMSPGQSAKYDYLTGAVLQDLGPRINCTRATGSIDSIFVRGGRDGTMRYDLTSSKQQHISPMRPSCQDGVIVSQGHLFWGPWMCDCNLTLVGVISLAPAGDFDYAARIVSDEDLEERLERPIAAPLLLKKPFDETPADWPTLRANNRRTAVTAVAAPRQPQLLWNASTPGELPLTAPTAVGGLVFTGGRDGVVRAREADTGELRWTAFTGGAITFPPTIANARAYVASADGWVYCYDAPTGQLLWRFRAAPANRVIPVYGTLSSTWPVNSGVLVENGVAYVAAGIANHDGTHVFALEAKFGDPRWHNSSSGSLRPETSAGVSVNGHLLLHGQQLHLAGGNMTPVASYDLATGRCVTDPEAPKSHTQFKAGGDLFCVGDVVSAGGAPLYSSKGDYRMVNQAVLEAPGAELVISYGPHDGRIASFAPGDSAHAAAKPVWQVKPLNRISGAAVASNAIVLVGMEDGLQSGDPAKAHLLALDPKTGATLWTTPLPATPSPWGVLLDRAGRIVVTLQDGRMLCFGEK